MNPSREVNGSGRILYRLYREEVDLSANGSWGTLQVERPMKRILGPVAGGIIKEWSPSGEYLRIDFAWFKKTDVDVVEVLSDG